MILRAAWPHGADACIAVRNVRAIGAVVSAAGHVHAQLRCRLRLRRERRLHGRRRRHLVFCAVVDERPARAASAPVTLLALLGGLVVLLPRGAQVDRANVVDTDLVQPAILRTMAVL